MTIRNWLRAVAGGGNPLGLALALVALVAAMHSATAQEQPVETVRPPYNHQPLALAYLAAPYGGSLSAKASDFGVGAPGAAVIARFLPRTGQVQPWDGIPFGLFKRTSVPGASTRLGVVAGSVIGVGTGKALDLKLYAFLPPEQMSASLRLLTYESDAWQRQRDLFSVLSDTTFVLAIAGGGGPPGGGDGSGGHQLSASSNTPGSGPYTYGVPPPYSYGRPDTGFTGGGDGVACVNKRAAPPGDRSPGCVEGTGEVIEDPLSGDPALLMYPRGGPPRWLTGVPTEICIEDGKRLPGSIAVPFGTTSVPVTLVERKGQHLCTRASVILDYELIRRNGIDIDGEKLRRLGGRASAGSGWKMLAAAPSPGASGWVQRIVLVPPVAPPVVGAPKVTPAPPAPDAVTRAPAATFSVILPWQWSLSIRKLWYAPLPTGAGKAFRCETGGLSLGGATWTRDKLALAEAVSVSTVYRVPLALRLDVSQPPTRAVPPGQGVILLAEDSGGGTLCGIGLPQAGSAELEGRLLPDGQGTEPPDQKPAEKTAPPDRPTPPDKAAPPPAPAPVVTADLSFQREGSAALIIERLSQGKATRLADLDAASLGMRVQWSDGDRLRIRPADPEVQGVSAVHVDGASFKVSDDRSVEIPLTAQMRTIAVKTALRPLSGFLTIATPGGAVDVRTGGVKMSFPMSAEPRRVILNGLKLGDEVTVEPKDGERLMVSRLMLRGGSPRVIEGGTFAFQRADMLANKLDLRVDVELKSNALALPGELLLRPVVQLGKRPLAIASCKITLAGLPADEFHHEGDGRTRVKIGPDKRGRPGAIYPVEVGGSAKVCAGFEGEAVTAQKLLALPKGSELAIPIRRPAGRAFVGVLSWPISGPDDEGNWRAAMKALVETFAAGADEGHYLWGAIYAPDGRKVVASETADFTPMDTVAFSADTLTRFKAGGAAPAYEETVTRVLGDVADMGGTVDLLVVATGAQGACKWQNPFASAPMRGGRSALVRVTKAAPGQAADAAARARICEVVGGNDGVGVAVEVAVDPATAGGASDRLLREALEAASKGLLVPAPPVDVPKAGRKADAELPPADSKIASITPPPPSIGKGAAADTYVDRYELPDDYRPLAVAYLAAPFAGSLTGPAGTFRAGSEPPGSSLLARFLKPADGAEPWQGVGLGLFQSNAGQPGPRLSVTDGVLGLGGGKALHPALYLFASDELKVVGLQKVLTTASDAGLKGGEFFSILSDTSFVLRAYLEAPTMGIESIACVNKGGNGSGPACGGDSGQVVEDPLTGGPALLMLAGSAAPKWLAAVPTELCVDGTARTSPKLAVPSGAGKHREIGLARRGENQGELSCTDVTSLNYVWVREDGIRIDAEPPRKRLDTRLKRPAGTWSLLAAAPRKGPAGDWVQRLLLVPPT